MTIRPIHDFGPAVGEYVPGIATDIRETFDRQRIRNADLLEEEPPRLSHWIEHSFETRRG
jgi:hypothetical protein